MPGDAGRRQLSEGESGPGEPLVNGQMDMYDLLRDDWLARDTAPAAEPEQPELEAPERPSEPKRDRSRFRWRSSPQNQQNSLPR